MMPRFFRRSPLAMTQRRSPRGPKWFRPSLEILEGRLLPSSFPVTSTADSGLGTLRQAIVDANANPGADMISFAIPGPGVHTIQPVSALPSITDSVVIDGTTQPGYAGKPLIQLDGLLAGSANGLLITANGCTVRGLDIVRFSQFGIGINGGNNNTIQANYVGTDPTGTKAMGNASNGVVINGASKSNLIGTNGDGINDAAERNLISGNAGTGVGISGIGTNMNVVAGNFIGTDVTGGVSLGNKVRGVAIRGGAQFNRIGTDGNGVGDIAERNIISGNAQEGVFISEAGTNQNIVAGNFIGTNAKGTASLPNGLNGVQIANGAQSNRIGVSGGDKNPSAERNVISGNTGYGIEITDAGTKLNTVAGNFIGTDATGSAALANGLDGIGIHAGARSNLIGTNADGAGDGAERNVISGNKGNGVSITDNGTNSNVVAGNFIGTDITGSAALANGNDGVYIANGARSNLVGTNGDGVSDAIERNLISGNLGIAGVRINNVGSNGNVVAGNFIGTNASGTAALSNAHDGVIISKGAQGNRIGANGRDKDPTGERNLISGNLGNGVRVTNPGTSGNVVAGNFIGTNVSGTGALGNSADGVLLNAAAQGNLVGTNADGVSDGTERNVIGGNFGNGVNMQDQGTINNVVAGNYIGTNAAGNAAVPNGTRGGSGIFIHGGASLNRIGTNADGVNDAAERNVISGNIWSGVRISDLGTSQNTIAGNFIGTNTSGAAPLPNQGDGIHMDGGTQNNPVGGSSAAANVIAFNDAAGVKIEDSFTTGNAIRINSIFSNAALGIDLNGDGVTPNAPGVRNGANDTQNYPVLAKAISITNSTQVTGSLNSLPSQAFTIDFYASPLADPSGFGEGKRHLGSVIVTTNASGNSAISATLPVGGLAGQVISATSTDGAGNTSEFSRDITATAMARSTGAAVLADDQAPAGAFGSGITVAGVGGVTVPAFSGLLPQKANTGSPNPASTGKDQAVSAPNGNRWPRTVLVSAWPNLTESLWFVTPLFSETGP